MKNTFTTFCKSFFRFMIFALLLQPLLGVPEVSARNLAKRLGAGFVNQIAVSENGTLPAIDAKYYVSRRFATSLGLGFDTRSDRSTVAIGTKFFYNLFGEKSLIFYVGSGIAILSQTGTKAQFSAFFGSEFFFPDLSSLGFAFEAGVRGDSSRGKFSMRTSGDHILTAGIHFYF